MSFPRFHEWLWLISTHKALCETWAAHISVPTVRWGTGGGTGVSCSCPGPHWSCHCLIKHQVRHRLQQTLLWTGVIINVIRSVRAEDDGSLLCARLQPSWTLFWVATAQQTMRYVVWQMQSIKSHTVTVGHSWSWLKGLCHCVEF